MSGSLDNSTSPRSYSNSQLTAVVSSSSSPPHDPFPSNQNQLPLTGENAMSTDVFNPVSQVLKPIGNSFSYPFSAMGPPASFDPISSNPIRLGDSDRSAQPLDSSTRVGNGGAILMRKLPKNTSREALRSMLLFAKDFVDADFVPSEAPEDNAFLCAVARFNTLAAAEEARALLDGKPNSKNDAKMIVELYNAPVGPILNMRRNTIDHTATRGLLSGVGTNGSLARQSSRFNGTFQSLERLNAANSVAQSNSDALSASESNSRLQSIFSPQSPISNGVSDLPRVSGKSMIDLDPDEETGELLKDPVGYAESGHSGSLCVSRRATNPQIPASRFASLSLNTTMSPPMQNYAPTGSARLGIPAQSAPFNPMVNGSNNINGSHVFHYSNQHPSRHSLPAANPNDLNPPCNTLYVGNLPPDTSEEELKALFSKQRGYKRLCFRNKQNGPMCFVEFDEVAMASKALNELYGYKLSNSVKTGIRLSFSKNPLGVRSGQPGSNVNPSNSLTQQGPVLAGNNLGGMPNMFSAVSGPPPGLAAPPGLAIPMGIRNGATHPHLNPHTVANTVASNGTFNSNSGLGIRTNAMNGMLMNSPPLSGGGTGGNGPNMAGFNSFYPDYMMGR